MELWRKQFRNAGAKTSVHDLEKVTDMAIGFERIGSAEKGTNPVVRVMIDAGVGVPFQALMYLEETESARAALEKSGWSKETHEDGTFWKL